MRTLLTILGMMLLAQPGWAGNELGNGGDAFAQEFIAAGRALVEKSRKNPDPRIGDAEALAAAVEGTAVSTKDYLELNGVEVDAVNYPASKRIEVNRRRWQQYSAAQKSSLVLHEYLGILGVDDSKYQVSSLFLAGSEERSSETERSRYSLGIGTGYQSFGGNAGKIYKSDGPILELVGTYALAPTVSLRAGMDFGRFHHDADWVGYVESSVFKVSGGAQFFLPGNRQWASRDGLDPYLTAGASLVYRRQLYQVLQRAERDGAFGAEGGLGLRYISGKRMAVWVEGKLQQIFFKDRFLQEYPPWEIPDKTGLLASAVAGLQVFF